eukprot:TRINITY_DN16479_c0_g1_i1.p2 TRINITY_DN16479_c0_g1~~TRINITY_DN16479_c0_g1_i1.p2  ORF type:complete len:173 (+),score=29.97 TRINITY_DN16479_c0_g1_i1:20-538(+)
MLHVCTSCGFQKIAHGHLFSACDQCNIPNSWRVDTSQGTPVVAHPTRTRRHTFNSTLIPTSPNLHAGAAQAVATGALSNHRDSPNRVAHSDDTDDAEDASEEDETEKGPSRADLQLQIRDLQTAKYTLIALNQQLTGENQRLKDNQRRLVDQNQQLQEQVQLLQAQLASLQV